MEIGSLGAGAQSAARPTPSPALPAQSAALRTPAAPPPSLPNLSPILDEIRKIGPAANSDIGRLRIEKWKAENAQKHRMEQVAESLQRNITTALPGLANDLQAAPDSVSKAFKLYHNLNVVYEFLNSLTEAAGTFGKGEEYGPLAKDVSSLDNVRQSLSSYIEQSASSLETTEAALQARQTAVPAAQAPPPPKRIVIDDTQSAKTKKTRKKPAAPAAQPTPSPGSASTPPQK